MQNQDGVPNNQVILLVDDERDHLIITKRFLESRGRV
jgi:hypothetical protein